MIRWLWLRPCAVVLLLGSCAAPPLKLYTLSTPPTPSVKSPLGRKPVVIAIDRVSIPNELDTEEIMIRDGSTLQRSAHGRWANRLSLGITDRITERLARRRPDAVVTQRPMTEAPSYRVLINIGRMDVTSSGVATLDADWLIVPHDETAPTLRDRTHINVAGPVATDQDVVTLDGRILDGLANAITLPERPRGSR